MTIAKGELHTKLDADILERKDELGQMGRCLIKMQRSLQELIKKDILTGLYNRRSCEKILLVYDDMQLDTAVLCMEEFLNEIRGKLITYGDISFRMTMTFGITEGNDRKIEHIVREADAKLYEGKTAAVTRPYTK